MASFDRKFRRGQVPASPASSTSFAATMGSPQRGGLGMHQQQEQNQSMYGQGAGLSSPQQPHHDTGMFDGPMSYQQRRDEPRSTNFLLRPKQQQQQQQRQQQQQQQYQHEQQQQHLSASQRPMFGGDSGSLFSPHPSSMGQSDTDGGSSGGYHYQQNHHHQQQQQQGFDQHHSSMFSTSYAGAYGQQQQQQQQQNRPLRPSGLRNEQGLGMMGNGGAVTRTKTSSHVDPPISGLHDTESPVSATPSMQLPTTATAIPPQPSSSSASSSLPPSSTGVHSTSVFGTADAMAPHDSPLSRVPTHVHAGPHTPARSTHHARAGGGDTCVTVFGFTPEHAGHVLSELGSCGTIVRKQHGAGNWIHIQFSSRIEAQRALSRSGHVLHGRVMIGVIPCTDDDFLSGAGQTTPTTPGVLGTPMHKKTPRILGTKKSTAPGTPGGPTTATVSPSRSYIGALGDFLWSW
ncbi:hypothetical protein PTSG_10512 [Salpingoeca rosetta]|uniref:RRM Nup35-type domain-containing protein n=1 Tax=Salpingoeca rosetta (strain ATCC 50818 / BSB-021) TaxID=946362 RepID=F2UPV7_SALR5|nr:uncharacterized protein PTSG_10512 [Salpingoeca rosetta]EGD79662.1 hypothetical protein PTSG_10512 [Salpingoeca rosetta]|eukprot:XP_004988890.1 hypothetical protein PTSG_10512 [Salpingoeca rosetta]